MMPRAPAPLAAALTASAVAAVAAYTADARAPVAQVEAADRTPWTNPVYDDVLDVVELTADRIQGDYAAGRYSALELVQAYLARIDTLEQVYNAFVSMNGNARETAARLDEEYRRSGPRGPLHGVPLVIKDNMDYGACSQATTSTGCSFLRRVDRLDPFWRIPIGPTTAQTTTLSCRATS